MTAATRLESEPFYTTDGEIAIVNLDSTRLRSWTRFFQNPLLPGIAESVIEHEQLTAQFVGDLSALDRLESLGKYLVQLDPASARTALIQAQIASMMHHFSDARRYLAQASIDDGLSAEVTRLQLNVDQACGVSLEEVLDKRRWIARKSGRLEDLVALGALLADLREFTDADQTYRQALRQYQDVSPFPVAWVYFQLGVLWGELLPEPNLPVAEQWYRQATSCLPRYVKARVHLAEIYSIWGRTGEAEALLVPAISSGDPEVRWRLADALFAEGERAEADAHLETARLEFESLLERHLLAFADHGAEFYAGSGNNPLRALELARVNVANRPTLRAFEQTYAIAVAAGEAEAAAQTIATATKCCGRARAFQLSSLAQHRFESREGAVA
jgi:tetratricopeptide (TPR) repeat protein